MTAPITPSGGGVEHTPTPWLLGQYSSIVGLPIAAQPDPTKNTIILCGVRGDRKEAEANAAFIVEACNSHATLKARIEELEAALGIFVPPHASATE